MKKQELLKKRHNRIKRRLELGMDKPGDKERLLTLKQMLGYRK